MKYLKRFSLLEEFLDDEDNELDNEAGRDYYNSILKPIKEKIMFIE